MARKALKRHVICAGGVHAVLFCHVDGEGWLPLFTAIDLPAEDTLSRIGQIALFEGKATARQMKAFIRVAWAEVCRRNLDRVYITVDVEDAPRWERLGFRRVAGFGEFELPFADNASVVLLEVDVADVEENAPAPLRRVLRARARGTR